MPITWWGVQNTYLQFNIYNLTNTRYPNRISTVTNTQNIVLSPTATAFGKSFFYVYDNPRTLQVTLHAEF